MMKFLLILMALAGRPNWQHISDQYGHKTYYVEILDNDILNDPPWIKHLVVAEDGDTRIRYMDIICDIWMYEYKEKVDDKSSSQFVLPAPGSVEDRLMVKLCPKM